VVEASASLFETRGADVADFPVVASDQFPPFTKKLEVLGLTLVARDEIDDDFLRLVARATQEIFPVDTGLDLTRQNEILFNQLRYGALIPVPLGDDLSFLDQAPGWPTIEARYSVCDIIMQGVPNQVMEVVEHILHYTTDLGLHYTFPEEWGLDPKSLGDSELRRAMNLAIERGFYDVDSYQDIEQPEVRDRVILQEFAYWFISTAWDLQEDYGPREEEWQIRNSTELAEKLPEFFAVYQRTVARTMAPPSLQTLEAIGPKRHQ
jgi:hypothetical protein